MTKRRSSAQKPIDDFIEFSEDMVKAARRSSGPLGKLSMADVKVVLERYRKFLALAKHYPTKCLAPTADIDEMWHLHMLMPRAYSKDCNSYFGGLLDHNGGFGRQRDEVEKLKKMFNVTEGLWKEKFPEEDYAVGGTALPLAVCFNAATQAHSICYGAKAETT